MAGREAHDDLIAGSTLIGTGVGILAGLVLPGFFIGLGLGLGLSTLRKPAGSSAASSSPKPEGRPVSTDEAAAETQSAKPGIDAVWKRIVGHQGDVFRQFKGREFTYQVTGNALRPSTTNVRIHKSQFAKALEHVPFAKVSDVPAGVFGPSYVYAILMDPRVRNGDW